MKNIFLPFLFLTLFSSAQDGEPSSEKTTETQAPEYILELQALSSEDLKKYKTLSQQAYVYRGQKRVFECLDAIYELEQISDGNPGIMILKGACHVELRAFDKARTSFQKALEVYPGDFNILFNLAEIEFVTKNFEKCYDQMKEVAQILKKGNRFASMLPLVKFKMVLCLLAQDKVAEAEKMVEGTTFLDDNLLYYYGNAALAYHAEENTKAEKWVARGNTIFENTSSVGAWQDTLVEFGYIKSFYGGDIAASQ